MKKILSVLTLLMFFCACGDEPQKITFLVRQHINDWGQYTEVESAQISIFHGFEEVAQFDVSQAFVGDWKEGIEFTFTTDEIKDFDPAKRYLVETFIKGKVVVGGGIKENCSTRDILSRSTKFSGPENDRKVYEVSSTANFRVNFSRYDVYCKFKEKFRDKSARSSVTLPLVSLIKDK